MKRDKCSRVAYIVQPLELRRGRGRRGRLRRGGTKGISPEVHLRLRRLDGLDRLDDFVTDKRLLRLAVKLADL